jgi:hypothetical protein
MKTRMRWLPVLAALMMMPACSTPPPRAAAPQMNSPLPAATLPAQPTSMNENTPNAPQVDPALIVPSPTPASPSREVPDDSPAVQAAIAALAAQLNVDAQRITVVSVDEVEWPDGCLGLGKPDQMCTMAIVPGYRVILEVDGTQHEVRTSLDGRQAGVAPTR